MAGELIGTQQSICQYHTLNDSVIHDLRDSVKVLIDGQQEMRVSVMQLTEALKAMDRIERKIDKLEDAHKDDLDKFATNQRIRNKEIDIEIGNLKAFVYKVTGFAIAAGSILGLIFRFYLGV